MADLTVIFFSCRRLQILRETVWAFININKYPIKEFIIVNDSADPVIHKQLEDSFENVTFIFNKENVGLMKAIDLAYPHIQTEYFFHAEDDWKLTAPGFIENSMKIMQERSEIEEVWPQLYNIHDAEAEVYQAGGVHYRLVTQFHLQGQDGPYGWHGFSTAFSLKRKSDYLKVAPYCSVPWLGSPVGNTIWQREQAIGEEYRKLSYRTAVICDSKGNVQNYAVNIGYGKSEYVNKTEKDGRNDKY